MKNLKENCSSLNDEKILQQEVNKAIDNKDNFVFDAGAGAGKTYALIESLKYITKTNGRLLLGRNQNILCITYTNAAADNIKSKLVSNNIVKVSTIHERIWDLINLHQDALLIEHKNKLNLKLITLMGSFNNTGDEDWFNKGDNGRLRSYFLQSDVKEQFYNSTNITLDFESILEEFGYVLNRNLGKFKKVIKFLYDTENINKCLNKINSGENKIVKYNAKFNNDRLHHMLISHDTLLEYGLALCEKYPMLRRIVIDSYPYIFIDEYQDTNINVVKLMYALANDTDYSKNLLVGYFGDPMQSIYSDGVSNKLLQYHPELLKINKKFNRRSRNEIIEVSNRFRNDGLLQESIYDNNSGGSFNFYKLTSKRPDDSFRLVSEFISQELNISSDERIHCLVLKNEMLAELSGFKLFYIGYKDFFFFKEQSQSLISRDLNKLNSAIRVIYELMAFRNLITVKTKSLEDILPSKNIVITMSDAENYISELKALISHDIKTFEEFLNAIFILYENGSVIYKKKINEILPDTDFIYSLDGFRNFLKIYLSHSGVVKEENRTSKIDAVINLDLKLYIRWYEFISDSNSEQVTFHTYHSTKGLEYKNVIIIMENSFSNNSLYFPDFFKSPNNPDFQERRNLLYVACSRAVCNMNILYLDSIESFKEQMSQFFGEALDFNIIETVTEIKLENAE